MFKMSGFFRCFPSPTTLTIIRVSAFAELSWTISPVHRSSLPYHFSSFRRCTCHDLNRTRHHTHSSTVPLLAWALSPEQTHLNRPLPIPTLFSLCLSSLSPPPTHSTPSSHSLFVSLNPSFSSPVRQTFTFLSDTHLRLPALPFAGPHI